MIQIFFAFNFLKTNSYLEVAFHYNCSLKLIKYFEFKAKDAPNFELQIIYSYIAVTRKYYMNTQLLKYLESKYPLYITDYIIKIALFKTIYNYNNFEIIKYLNKNNKYLNKYLLYELLSISLTDTEFEIISKIIKYVYSKTSELKLSRFQYTEFYNERIYNRIPFKQIGNYFIRYRAKYRLLYI